MRCRAVLSGWQGGPGLMTFYFTGTTEDAADAGICVDRVHAALVAGAGLWNRQIRLQVSGDVDVITPSTGAITNTLSVPPPAVIVGAENDDTFAPFATAQLLAIKTGTFLAGRRLQGRMFLSPLGGNMLEGNGTASIASTTAATTLGNVLYARIAAGDPGWSVWRRPRAARVLPTPLPARAGDVGLVTSWLAKDKLAVLRSRRD